MKTLVLHEGALGDVLLSVPCLRAIRACSGPLQLAARGDVALFLKQTGIAAECVSSDKALFASLYACPDPRLGEYLAGFDTAYVFTADGQTGLDAAVNAFIPRTLLVRTIPPANVPMHAAAYRLSQLASRTASPETGMVQLPVQEVEGARALLLKAGYRPGRPLIGLHPGSGGKAKCWPLVRFLEVCSRMRSLRDVFVVLFTGEAEKGNCREAVSGYASRSNGVLHADDLDLMSAAALLSLCTVYAGNDSGFSHLAGLLDCPSVVLFGPTDPAVWKPLGSAVRILSSNGPLTELCTDDVFSEMTLLINSRLR